MTFRSQIGRVLVAAFALLARTTLGQASHDTVRPLPRPSGPRAVGTAVAYFTDSARRDADFPGGRPIVLQLWYPAARAGRHPAPYLIERGLAAELLRGPYYGLDTTTLARWPDVRTYAALGASVASGRHALITFSVGLGVIRANYTTLAEELASYDYVVALVESPLAGLIVLPDGRVVQDTTSRLETASAHRAAVAGWARDVTFVLDRLQTRRVPPALAPVAQAVDWGRVGATGHSSGGVVAIMACERDVRVRACVDLDGGMASPAQEPMADFVATGTTKPTFVVQSAPDYSDADFARRGLTRAEWARRGEGGRIALDSVVARAHGPIWVAKVRGTGHFSFSDAPFVMPSAITRFGGRIIAPQRGLVVITATLRAFFDQELGGRAGALAAAPAALPELTLRGPRR